MGITHICLSILSLVGVMSDGSIVMIVVIHISVFICICMLIAHGRRKVFVHPVK